MVRNNSAVAVLVPVWFAVGIWTALQNGYNSFASPGDILSFIIAMTLWPVALWTDYNLHFPLDVPSSFPPLNLPTGTPDPLRSP
jgi:hypothetical protein